MIPFYYLFLAVMAGFSGGLFVAIFVKPVKAKYNAFAELVELLTAKDLQAVADWFQAKANALKTPGK